MKAISHQADTDLVVGRHRSLAKKSRLAVERSSERAPTANGPPKLPRAKPRRPGNWGLDEALLEIAEIWRDVHGHPHFPPTS